MKKYEMKITAPDKAKLEAKVGGDSYSNGSISGYASVFLVQDVVQDVVMPGAFKRAIDNQIQARSVPLMVRHFRDGGDVMESIGVIVEAREDDIGLYIVAELDGTTASQEVRAKINANPAIFGMSIGFMNNGEGVKVRPDGSRELHEINLKEVTITLMPANESTLGTLRAKREDPKLNELLARLDALEAKVNESVKPDASALKPVASDIADEIARQKRVLSFYDGSV